MRSSTNIESTSEVGILSGMEVEEVLGQRIWASLSAKLQHNLPRGIWQSLLTYKIHKNKTAALLPIHFQPGPKDGGSSWTQERSSAWKSSLLCCSQHNLQRGIWQSSDIQDPQKQDSCLVANTFSARTQRWWIFLDPGMVFSMEEFTSLLISSAVTWKKPWTLTVFSMEEFTSLLISSTVTWKKPWTIAQV